MVDKLEHMFQLQKDLQLFLKQDITSQEYININFIAIVDESCEFIRNTKWKPWKKQQIFNTNNAKDELVDLFHFFMNLCMAVGMDADELFDRYKTKNAENIDRQKRGY